MPEERSKQAVATFDSLCAMLDAKNWHYTKNEQALTVECKAQGDDLPIDIRIEVDSQRDLVFVMSDLPFKVPEERRSALAVAVTAANWGLHDGNFDYDYLNGRILFRMTASFKESILSKDLLEYMLMYTCVFVDRYNDKFLVICKDNSSYDDIVNNID